MMSRAILSIVLLLCSITANAQFLVTPEIEAAQKSILELRFNKATKYLKKADKANPKNGFIPYLYSNIIFLKLFISDDPSMFESKMDSLEMLLDEIDDNDAESSPYYHYCLAELNFEIGAIQMQNGNNWKSAWSMLEAFNQIQDNDDLGDDFLPQQMMEGILNVTMGSLPHKYKVLASLLGFTGNVERGLSQLKSATQTENTSYGMFKKKFTFAYCYTLSVLEDQDLTNVWEIDESYEQSPLLVYLQARFYRNRGENEELIELLENRSRTGLYPFYYLDFMLGKAKFNRLDKDANRLFEGFLHNYAGQNSIKAANRYLSWYYFLEGDEALSLEYKQRTIDDGVERVGADKMALFDVSQPYYQQLVKARLFFDGGYLQKAKSELNFDPQYLPVKTLKLEYYYRLGRINQKQANEADAINAYKNVFKYHGATDAYYAANSALQLGMIYETQEQWDSAILYFNKTLNYASFPFEDGIHQRAKAGIQRVKQTKEKD